MKNSKNNQFAPFLKNRPGVRTNKKGRAKATKQENQ
jgi:hypothetical protein